MTNNYENQMPNNKQAEYTNPSKPNPHIFLSPAFPNNNYARENTGDTDYTKTLENHLKQQLGVSKVEYLSDINEDEKKVYQYIEDHTIAGEQKILHVMLNIPFTGYAFTPDGLKQFKENGGNIVITAIEFDNHRVYANLEKTFQYLAQADSIIFLDKNDKKIALALAVKYADTLDLSQLDTAQVIPVPATVPLSTVAPEKRGGDILSFGIIRRAKGFNHILELADLIKNSADPLLKDKKILIVGSLLKDSEQQFSELSTLMDAIYPTKVKELEGKATSELAVLLKQYQEDPNLEPALPVELHVNVDKEKLPELFNRCTYSYLPAFRGGTFRNSSISTSLANKFITYSHVTHVTPEELQPKGKYADSMVLSANPYGKYAESVFANISKREQDKSLNEKTWQAIDLVKEEVLSIDKITGQHLQVYGSAANIDLVKSKEIQQADTIVDSSEKQKNTLRKLTPKEGEKLFEEIVFEERIDEKSRGYRENKDIIKIRNFLDKKLKDVDIDSIKNKKGQTLIHYCVEYNKEELLKLLFNYTPDINIKDSVWGLTPFTLGGVINNISINRLLLDYGTNINQKSREGSTALHYAAQEGKFR